MIHRTGKRATHKTRDYSVSIQSTEADTKEPEESEPHHEHTPEEKPAPPIKPKFNVGEIMENRAKFVPLRLKMEERKYLRL
jgi:hypothetical protein